VTAPSRARTPAPEPPEDPPPRIRGSLPSLDMTAGPVKLLARGGAAVYGGALAIVGVLAVYHLPNAIGAVERLSQAIDKSSAVLAKIGDDVRETRAATGRVEERTEKIEAALRGVAGEIEQLRSDVKAGCKR